MNILFPYESLVDCVSVLDDRRLKKMGNDIVVILGTVLRTRGVVDPQVPKASNPNHPCVLWAGATRENFDWLLDYLTCICVETGGRHSKNHSKEDLLPVLNAHKHKIDPGGLMLDMIPNGTVVKDKDYTIDFSYISNINDAYQEFLVASWKYDRYPPKWTGRFDQDFDLTHAHPLIEKRYQEIITARFVLGRERKRNKGVWDMNTPVAKLPTHVVGQPLRVICTSASSTTSVLAGSFSGSPYFFTP